MAQLPTFFVSHAGQDMAFADQLASDLRAAGLKGFLDAHSIKPGEDIVARVNDGLEQCDVYLPILSAAALQSRWCIDEINSAITLSNEPARKGRPRIIPVLIDNCGAALPPLLRHRLYVRFADAYFSSLWELLERGFEVDPGACVYRANMFSGPRLQTGKDEGDEIWWGAYLVVAYSEEDIGKTLSVRVESKGNDLSIELWRGAYDGADVGAWVRDRAEVARSPRGPDPTLRWNIEAGTYTVYFVDHVRLKRTIRDYPYGYWAYEPFPVHDYEILYRVEIQ
jgi:hypothetical protein